MSMNMICVNDKNVAVLNKDESINDVGDALDMMASARYNHDCDAVVVYKESLPEAFFDLKSKIAGEILQKFSNYRMKIVIVGDFSSYKSKSLRDFIYECNKGSTVFFISRIDEMSNVL